MSKIKKSLKLIFVNLIVIVVILLSLEGLTRLFSNTIRTQGTDDYLLESSVYMDSYGLRKMYSGEAFDRIVNTDENHSRKNSIPFNSSKKTILLLGDSVTMGVGVDDLETFSALLQQEKSNLNILNPSVIGYDTYDYLNVVTALKDKKNLNIDEVIIFFCLNDIYVRDNNDTAPMLSNKPFIGQIFDFLKTNSYFYIWLKGTFFDRSKVFFENDYNLYNEANVNEIGNNLNKIQKLCNENTIKFKVVLLPYEYQLRNHDSNDIYKPQQTLENTLKDFSIRTYNPSNYMKNIVEESSQAYLFADGIHFSEKGHKIISDYILTTVLDIKNNQ